jgi:hypothetical protein
MDPEPKGMFPLFQEIFFCLSVKTPTVAADAFVELRLSCSLEIDPNC